MTITLKGCPPSINQFAGRENPWDYRRTKQYWTTLVWATCLNNKERPTTPYESADVSIRYFFPTKTRHDADNYAGKFLLDGLTKAGVIIDDDMSHIRLHIAGGYDKQNPRTEITVTKCESG